MSEHLHKKAPHEHGTMQAYIIGFALSLVFTFIPYYLVAHHIMSGMGLLVTILGFGVLQMLIQVLFFLHLGRGKGPTWQQVFFVGTVVTILVVVGGSVIIISNLHRNMTLSSADQSKKLTNDEAIYQVGGKQTGACEGQHASHLVVIQNGLVIPESSSAQQCDTLTFINQDDEAIEIAFGEHPEHKAYAGEIEYIVKKHQNKTITLSDTGTFRFHNHLQPQTAGEFTVR